MRNSADFLNNADYIFTDRLMVRLGYIDTKHSTGS
jgi:hypothetical protein